MGRIWALALIVAALACADAQARVPIGLADQHPAALRDERVTWLGITNVRVVAPWNAALEPSAELDEWLRTARDRGFDALVSFGGAARLPPNCPTEAEMRAAFAAFRARWPWVTAFGTWNEGNHASQPSADDPEGTARLYETLAAACPDCRILAVELLDSPNMLSWLRRFRAGLSSEPRLWGLHNYSDVTRGSTAMTEALLAAVGGSVWITETGGLVRQLGRWPYDEERARASVARALQLAEAHADRIERMFIYQWQAAAHEPWDSGLIRADFSPRPSFTELAAWLRPPDPPPLSVLPPPPTPAACRPRSSSCAARGSPGPGSCVRASTARRPRRGGASSDCGSAGAGRTPRARPSRRATPRSPSGCRRGTRRAIRLRRTTRVTAEIRSLRARFVVRCRP